MIVVVVQWLSHIWLFMTPWTAACQVSLSFIISQSLLKPMSIEWWCLPTILSSVILFSSCLHSFPASESFLMSQLFTSGGQSIGASASSSIFPMNIQDWPLYGWLVWSCSPRDSQESSPTPQFKSINPSVLSLLLFFFSLIFWGFFSNFILFFNFTILYWFCHISKWICHRYTCVPYPEPSSLLPPHTIPLMFLFSISFSLGLTRMLYRPFILHQQRCLYPIALAAACIFSAACSDFNVISKPPSPHAIILI